jgi:ketosteroid isomerase-like protein
MSGLLNLDHDTVDAFTTLWEDLFNAGDHAAIAEYYAEGAVLIGSQMDTINGRAAIAEFWQRSCEGAGAAGIDRRVYVEDRHSDGDLGYLRGTVVLAVPNQPAPITVRYTTVWRRQPSGEWQLAIDISSPAPQHN